ncbi:hypothetical protein F5H01DRAFT_329455 [Linnemannia elongata]|nr:hypothetical protein F5H01DRAFT_329455 [Linnemannia elongata]
MPLLWRLWGSSIRLTTMSIWISYFNLLLNAPDLNGSQSLLGAVLKHRAGRFSKLLRGHPSGGATIWKSLTWIS